MTIREGKTYATRTAATTAITTAELTWTRPIYQNVGGGRHVDHATLPPQKLAEPFELRSGRWAVIADHPDFRGEEIDDADRREATDQVRTR